MWLLFTCVVLFGCAGSCSPANLKSGLLFTYQSEITANTNLKSHTKTASSNHFGLSYCSPEGGLGGLYLDPR